MPTTQKPEVVARASHAAHARAEDDARRNASRREGKAFDRLQAGVWPAPSTVTEIYGTWAAASADVFG